MAASFVLIGRYVYIGYMIFLGIDLGASALKLALIRQDGLVLARARAAIKTHNPQPGWQEQHPNDWLMALENTLHDLWQNSSLVRTDIDAISITAGAHIGVLGDENHEPLRPSIMWSDQRAAEEVENLRPHEDAIIKASLHKPNATWTMAHLRWLWVHEYDVLKKTRHLTSAKDWLRFQLTGDWCTDISDAVGSQLYDYKQKKWSLPLCALAGVLPDILPTIHRSQDIGGTVSKKAAQRFALQEGVPIYIGGIDTGIELYNAGIEKETTGCLKLASAGVISLLSADPSAIPPISCYPQNHGTGWYFASGMNNCATALDWFRANHLNGISLGQMQAQAKTAPAGANGVLFHPYINGERAPHWQPRLQASLSGMTDATQKSDLARAAFEGVAYALYDVRRDFEKRLNKLNKSISDFVALGGGAHNSFWMQIICDIQGVPFKVPEHTDAAYGAALFAGLAHGAYPNPLVLGKMINFSKSYQPDMALHEIYMTAFEAYDRRRIQMMREIDPAQGQ